MISIERMLHHATEEGAPRPYSCVDAVAASLPQSSRAFAAYTVYATMTGGQRSRALRSPIAAARLVARKIRAPRATDNGPAWGVVEAGQVVAFAVRSPSGRWWARSSNGICPVHPSRVIHAWEIV